MKCKKRNVFLSFDKGHKNNNSELTNPKTQIYKP